MQDTLTDQQLTPIGIVMLACSSHLGHGNKGVISEYRQMLLGKSRKRTTYLKWDIFLQLFAWCIYPAE